MDLSIICVNWNSADYMKQCLASIRQHTGNISYEVIVVDNASSSAEFEKLQKLCMDATILRSEENLGFARANNLGYRNSSGDYLLFLNPDTELIGPAINRMLEKSKTLSGAGIVGCKLLNTDRSVQLSSIQKFPTILNQVLDAEYLLLRWPRFPLWALGPLFLDEVEPVKVDVISGACMLLQRRVFEQVGLFSEDYFMYAEDIDLNFKVNRAGYLNYYVGGAEIVHHGGGSSSKQRSQWSTIMKHNSMRRYCRNTRGRLYENLYRMAMGATAVARLTLLTMAYSIGCLGSKRRVLRDAMNKWMTILRWSIEGQTLPVKGR